DLISNEIGSISAGVRKAVAFGLGAVITLNAACSVPTSSKHSESHGNSSDPLPGITASATATPQASAAADTPLAPEKKETSVKQYRVNQKLPQFTAGYLDKYFAGNEAFRAGFSKIA